MHVGMLFLFAFYVRVYTNNDMLQEVFLHPSSVNFNVTEFESQVHAPNDCYDYDGYDYDYYYDYYDYDFYDYHDYDDYDYCDYYDYYYDYYLLLLLVFVLLLNIVVVGIIIVIKEFLTTNVFRDNKQLREVFNLS